MKGSIRFMKNILFFQPYKILKIRLYNFLSAYRHTALSMTLLKGGNCSSALCNTIIGINFGRNCMLFCKLTMCSSLMTDLMNVVYKNFSDTDSKPLTGCTKHGIFALVLKDIFIVSFQHNILYGKLCFYF
jgi:hypothetical protein